MFSVLLWEILRSKWVEVHFVFFFYKLKRNCRAGTNSRSCFGNWSFESIFNETMPKNNRFQLLNMNICWIGFIITHILTNSVHRGSWTHEHNKLLQDKRWSHPLWSWLQIILNTDCWSSATGCEAVTCTFIYYWYNSANGTFTLCLQYTSHTVITVCIYKLKVLGTFWSSSFKYFFEFNQ